MRRRRLVVLAAAVALLASGAQARTRVQGTRHQAACAFTLVVDPGVYETVWSAAGISCEGTPGYMTMTYCGQEWVNQEKQFETVQCRGPIKGINGIPKHRFYWSCRPVGIEVRTWGRDYIPDLDPPTREFADPYRLCPR